MKELRNFVTHNVRFPDLRVKAIDGRPTVPLVACGNLLDLVREATVDPNRDFFLRLSSFSLPVTGKDTVDPEAVRRFRNSLRQHLPWMSDEVFGLRNKRVFKDNMARAVCCGLRPFDLVIVDEGHNLKHGFGERVAARNRVLALCIRYPDDRTDKRLFPGYGPRAWRVLFLSATPVEESYRHLWNQLHVFGRSGPFDGLLADDLEEDAKKAIAGKFLVRRVTLIKIGEAEYTKNLYRREWRRGGVKDHDEPVRVDDPKQRLVVALATDRDELRMLLRERSKGFLSRAKRHARADRFEAVQASAIEWLKDQKGEYQEQARIVWRERFRDSLRNAPTTEAPEIGDWLEAPTFFTELRQHAELRQDLWPRSGHTDAAKAFREEELRGQLLASAARLGHPLIDLYIIVIRRLRSLEQRTQETADEDSMDLEVARIGEYLELLEKQRQTPRGERD